MKKEELNNVYVKEIIEKSLGIFWSLLGIIILCGISFIVTICFLFTYNVPWEHTILMLIPYVLFILHGAISQKFRMEFLFLLNHYNDLYLKAIKWELKEKNKK